MKKHPKTKSELMTLISARIAKEGVYCNLNDIDVSAITNFDYLFEGSEFNGNISKWDVSNATTMRGMFAESDFNGDISKWNVSKVKNMVSMFASTIFDRDISAWDTSSVKYRKGIFDTCPLEYLRAKQPKFNH